MPELKMHVSVDEYILMRIEKGQRFAVIDDATRLEIVAQESWEKEVFIEEIPDSPVFKLWRLKDWQWHREVNPGIKEERKQELAREHREAHNKLEAWKREARARILKTGKVPPDKIESYIRKCLEPKEQFDFNLRDKLNFPVECVGGV